MSENNLTGYEKRYNAVYNYLDTHKALKNILLLLYKVLPYVTALSYMVLIVLCARSKSTIATPAIALSVDATGYVETSNVFITAKLILAPLTSFIFVSFIRKCLDSPRPYTKYNITPIVKKDKEWESNRYTYKDICVTKKENVLRLYNKYQKLFGAPLWKKNIMEA